MHERSLVRALLRQVQQIADAHADGRVASVHVRLGEFSGVEATLFAAAFSDLVAETRLRGATLELEQVPLEAVCEECGSQRRIEQFIFECGQCGSNRLAIRGGEEMLLDSVMMEESVL